MVTTVAPLTSIVSAVAGSFADVHGLIPEGVDSHTYEPKPGVSAELSQADLVFLNGLHLEDGTRSLALKLAPSAKVVTLGELTISPDQYIYDRTFPRSAGHPNPHLWTNPPMAKCYATIASATMSAADPTNAAAYAASAAVFAADIDRLDQMMQDATSSMPSKNRALLSYHDAYAYFAVRYGWRIVGAVQVADFEEPTPGEVAKLIGQIRAEKLPAIFGSEVFPSPVLEQIGRETGARYVDKLRDDDLPGVPGEPDHSYFGLMRFDFVTMVSSLGGDASKLAEFRPTASSPDSAEYPQ